MRNLIKRALAVVMSIVLALGLCPGFAAAGAAEGGNPLAAGSGGGLAAAPTSLDAQEGDDVASCVSLACVHHCHLAFWKVLICLFPSRTHRTVETKVSKDFFKFPCSHF